MCKFSSDNKQKLGNTIIYIAQHTESLSKTKLLKLLYLMEERMALRYHVPFLGIPFEVWQAGPVAKDVFVDLSGDLTLLQDYVTAEACDNATYIKAKRAFDDDEFSDSELDMMASVMKKYGAMTAHDLVEITHHEGGLWYKEAEQHNLLEPFRNRECNNSDVVIDFTKAMSDCAAQQYTESLNIRQTANYLKAEYNV